MAAALRLGWGASLLLLASGAVYAAVGLVAGVDWGGPVSLRKPALFGVSTGVTLASLTWVMAALPRRRFDGVLFTSLVISLGLEVALIDLQQARGVASHFNRSTSLDSFITSAMGALILWATAVIVLVTVRAFGRIELPDDSALAARAGLVLLVVACGIGIVITGIGESQQARGFAPEVYGEAGVLKFAHGLPLHALQILPAQAWLLRHFGVAMAARLRSLFASIVGLVFATTYGVVQTALGAPRWPPLGVAWSLVALCALAFAVAAVLALRRHSRPM